jgi:translation initiation factor RLI1
MYISYKPQKIAPKFDGTVKDLLLKKLTKVTRMHESKNCVDLGFTSIYDRSNKTNAN